MPIAATKDAVRFQNRIFGDEIADRIVELLFSTTITETCKNDKCPRGGVPVTILIK